MYKHRKKTIASIIVLLTISVLIVSINYTSKNVSKEPIQPAKANPKFVLSTWDFPDEYGQGIYGFFFDENSTGVFIPVGGPIILSTNDSIFEFDAGFALGMDVRVNVNYTLLGLEEPDPEDPLSIEYHPALNYIRLNVTVTAVSEIVFSQSNITYDELGGDTGDGVWYYSYVVEFDFINVAGTVYVITLTYEVYY